MNKKSNQGFTLIELLVVVALVIILAVVVILVINPAELMRRSRDARRISDLDNLNKAITLALPENPGNTINPLCFSLTPPCRGQSNTSQDSSLVNGRGWVAIVFEGLKTVTLSRLPMDPINNSQYNYTYYSDGVSYEINAILESNLYQEKMQTDGGDNDNLYEIGSSRTLLN